MMRAVRFLWISLLLAQHQGAHSLEPDALFSNNYIQQVQLSPDGSKLSYLRTGASGPSVEVLNIGSGATRTVLANDLFPGKEAHVSRTSWIGPDEIFVEVYELTDGVARLTDTRNVHHRLIVSARSTSVRHIETTGQLVSSLPQDPDHLLYAVSGSTSYIYHIDTRDLLAFGAPFSKTAAVDGGQFTRPNRVAEVPGYALNWMSDSDGTITAVMYWNPEKGVLLATRSDNESEWQQQRSWQAPGRGKRSEREQLGEDLKEADYRLLSRTEDGFLALVTDDDGRKGVYRLNLESGEKELVFQHPTAEILNVEIDYNDNQLLSVSYFEGGKVRQHYFQEAPKQIAHYYAQRFPGHQAIISGIDKTRSRYAVNVFASNDAGRALVFDQAQQKTVAELSLAPSIETADLIKADVGSVQVDDLQIEYFLTKPTHTGPYPLVVFPHGRPFGIWDTLAFNPMIQFLAQRGFAVLQINYRGSGGYGIEFLEAGYGEFGQRMLVDIENAVSHVIRNAPIDARRICAIGDSYGGYAAMMLAVRQPHMYRCASSFAGPSDLGLILAHRDVLAREEMLKWFLGEQPSEDEHQRYQSLKSLSPLYNLAALRSPLLITHGVNDRVVDVEHTFRLRHALGALDVPATFHIYEEAGHGFHSAQTRYEHALRVADFLSEHLGTDAAEAANALPPERSSAF